MRRHSLSTRSLAIFLATLFFAVESVAVAAAPELPNPGRVSYTKDQQHQLGLQASQEVYKQMPVLPDSSPVTQYVQQLGRRLQTVIPQQDSWPYEFHVVQQKEINAFALPGGPIFINLGTITAADNEAQLAGVMAHEMSHVYMQHSIKQAEKQQMAQGLAGLLGAVIGNSGGIVGSLAQAGISLGGGMVMLKYSRNDEAQADAVGAIIMYKAGYDPRALPAFFQKLEQQGGQPPQFLSDHPNPGNRVASIDKEIAPWPPKKYLAPSSAFASARQQAQGLKVYTAQQIADGAKQGLWARQNQGGGAAVPVSQPGPSGQPAPDQGGTASQVMPSGTFTTTSNSVFSMKYPDNWQAAQSDTGITIAPAAGLVQNGIAYGTMIGGYQPQNAGGDVLGNGTQQLISLLSQDNPGMKATGQPQDIRVNGAAGKSVDLLSNSPLTGSDGKPLRERDWVVTLQRSDGTLLFLVFIAPEKDFEKLQRAAFEPMLRSLKLN
jgi:Zn-dependent protease with chaperone function